MTGPQISKQGVKNLENPESPFVITVGLNCLNTPCLLHIVMITPAFTSNMHQIVRCKRESTPTGSPKVLWRAVRISCIGRD